MSITKRVIHLILLSTMVFSVPVFAETKGLFVDLSSGDLFKIRRAFMVGTMVRQNHKIPVTVNISLGATRFVDKALPLAMDAVKVRDLSVHEHMTMFMESGGEILICPMCLQGNGLSKDDLVAGIKVGGPDITLPRMLEDGVKTLSY